jgi:Serine/threonine protein phosphatase 2A, regulatory subunit
MEELTEVITAAEFHPVECNLFVYSSSKGTIRLCDMRAAALCDSHSKCEYLPVKCLSCCMSSNSALLAA